MTRAMTVAAFLGLATAPLLAGGHGSVTGAYVEARTAELFDHVSREIEAAGFKVKDAALRRATVGPGAVGVGRSVNAAVVASAVGIMVGSFRQTVLFWMEDRLRADLYLRPAGPAGADRRVGLG